MRGPASSPEFVGEGNSTVTSNDTIAREHDTINRSCSTSTSNTAYSKKDDNDGGTPIWKVGKILIDSLSKGKMRRSKIFGMPLEDLPLNCQGMPKIVQRLCSHLEQFGMKEADLFCSSKKQEKLVEKLKISFDRAGDADLEDCADVRVIASLLKLWLQDLPHPLIPTRISSRLKTLFEKYERKEVYDLNPEICNVLVTCPTLNLGVLYIVIRLLYDYVLKWIPSKHCDQLPDMFAKILIGGVEMHHIDIISTLMHNFPDIFNDRVLERAFQLYIIRDEKTRNEDRKRNRPLTTRKCENSPLAIDKLPRSNSEEELTLRNDYNQNTSTKNLNMRRVNSHEDFTGHSQHIVRCLVQSSGTDMRQACMTNDRLLSERPVDSTYLDEQPDEPILDNFQRGTRVSDKEDIDVLVAPPPLNYNDDMQIQEEIRNAERFNPRFTYRNNGRRKRTYQGYNVKQKIPIIYKDDNNYVYAQSDQLLENVPNRGNDITSDDLPYTCGIPQDNDTHSTSSNSSSSSSESTSPRREPMELLECRYRYLEPVTSPCNKVFAIRHSFESTSLPISQGRRSYSEIASVPAAHFSNVDMKISQVNRHLQWIKRKMKRFEKDFEDRCGGMSVPANKISHPEYKHMAVTTIYLKNHLKQLRKEASDGFSDQRLLINRSSQKNSGNDSCVSMNEKEKAFQDVEKQMHEIRIENKRPECVEAMTHEQLQEEKMSIEKELSFLESSFGQTAVHNEELFKPIYLRYRTVKRFLARSTVTLKLKESVSSDLVTIKENETMDFDTSPASINIDDTFTTVCQPICKVSRNDFPISNIHELSSPELMMEYKSTKEEKKKLRNKICMYKQEVENKATHNSKHCIHSLRCRYKNTKAKLKLLEVLLMKTK